MKIETDTERMRGFIQSAHQRALAEGHQQFIPEHLPKELVEDGEASPPRDRPCRWQRQTGAAAAQTALDIADGVRWKWWKIHGATAGEVSLCAEEIGKKAGDLFVTVERFLIALAMEQPTAKIMEDAGVTLFVRTRLSRASERAARRISLAEDGYDALKKYAQDLTALARGSKESRRSGAMRKSAARWGVLLRGTKNNPVLIGEPGVGKTAIAEAAARITGYGDVPESLREEFVAFRHGRADRRCEISRRVRGSG